MKRFFSIFLLLILCLTIAGCESKSSSDLSKNYLRQDSVSCTLSCEAVFGAAIGGAEYIGLTQYTTLQGQLDMDSGMSFFHGDMASIDANGKTTTTTVECYGADRSYYRYDSYYYSDEAENPYASIVNAPAILNLKDYHRAESTQLLNGDACILYEGTEIVRDSSQRLTGDPVSGPFSLDGCLTQVTLWVYEDTSLPAQMTITYTNLAELKPTCANSDGSVFTLTGLTYTVNYESYGMITDISIPEEFIQAASKNDLTNRRDQVPEELLDHGVVDFTGDPDADLSNAYAILNEDSSYCYVIDTPEFMDLEEHDTDYLCFYFLYDENDIEYISYTFCSHYTDEDEEQFALELPEYIEDEPGCSNVYSDGLESFEINGQDVRYTVVYYTMDSDGVTYDCMEIYSWIPAPNGRDCLEVDIVEYNGSGDEIFVDILDELIYAYEAILGGGNLK